MSSRLSYVAGGRDGKARCEGGAALAHDVRVDCAVYSVGNADEEDELLATRDGRETLGDRHHESLILQCFPDIGPSATPILAAFAGFPPGGDPLNEFIFDSFFFLRNLV